jgi:hypothetical protein
MHVAAQTCPIPKDVRGARGIRSVLSLRALLLLMLFLPSACAELAYQHMNDPSRDEWQKPQEVIATLAVKPGSRVADLGAGGG